MKKALVCGAGGFIGWHLVCRLKQEGFHVRGVDIKVPEFSSSSADEFILGDLRDPLFVSEVMDQNFDEVYQLAADMGGAGYIFTGEHDANIMHNSSLCNLNVLHRATQLKIGKIFYSSSACIYPVDVQSNTSECALSEDLAYPANPDSDYGWEKIFSERLYLSYSRNYNLSVRIARFHNIFGPYGTWCGGKEKAPAAICRKVAEASCDDKILIWGDGKQTRSFLYIDECLDGIRRLMDSDFSQPVNIGSEEMVSIDELAMMVAKIAGKNLKLEHIAGPVGVRGRSSDNELIRQTLNWAPSSPLFEGLIKTYLWIVEQIKLHKNSYPNRGA